MDTTTEFSFEDFLDQLDCEIGVGYNYLTRYDTDQPSYSVTTQIDL